MYVAQILSAAFSQLVHVPLESVTIAATIVHLSVSLDRLRFSCACGRAGRGRLTWKRVDKWE